MTGRDPYDALLGTRVPGFVRRQPRLRQLAIQARKRSPLDLGSLLGVKPFRMAKADGCFLTANARMNSVKASDSLRAAADAYVEALDSGSGNVGGGAWGYEFDVQTRWAFYAAGSPNLIATTFVARGFLAAGVSHGVKAWTSRGSLAASYVAENLVRNESDAPFIAYVPNSARVIHNANALGAGLLATAGTLAERDDWVELALACAQTTIAAQGHDGSWPYGEGAGLEWCDNFHTAYTLDGLLQLWLATGDRGVKSALGAGVEHWRGAFFRADGAPKYYPDRPYPFDIHSAATAVDTGYRLAAYGWPTDSLAHRVAAWTRRNLVDADSGRTYFQKHRGFVDRRNFMRWGEAHWALAIASERIAEEALVDPLEGRIVLATGVEQ